MTTKSYGEERPLAQGSDEYAWSQNRRVELVGVSGGDEYLAGAASK
jgi:outer membrane protein OmpA-like peptidoglycan-associated protein